uniref:Endonuclease/exonuclease/phosphatase domain-containing protein n=1 Tax=Denticeps clupeoides TaxID=299321 RepID=A0AAY4BVJ8_9TELE
MIKSANPLKTVRLGSLRSVRWNIKGLHHPIKRCRIFSHLKALAPEILFLQETHLRVNEHSKLKTGWVDHIFHSEYGDRSRGAAILIIKGVPFINESVISDTKGRFVIVIGYHNWDDPQFFYTFFAKLPHLDTYHLILGGTSTWSCSQI